MFFHNVVTKDLHTKPQTKLLSSPLQSFYLAMSLQNMNQMRLVPKKDYVANRLQSGALQLARNTSLFLDETQLEQGQLDTTGEARSSHQGATLTAQTVVGH